jgi:hypothetical protein
MKNISLASCSDIDRRFRENIENMYIKGEGKGVLPITYGFGLFL